MEKKQIATYFLIALLIVLLVGTIAFSITGGFKSKTTNATSTATTTVPTLTPEELVIVNKFLTSTSTEWKTPREEYVRHLEQNIYQNTKGLIEYETFINIASRASNGNVAQIPFEFQGKKWQLNCGLIDLSQPSPQPQ